MPARMAQRMHDDEIDSDPELVRALLAAQQPQWAALPIERVESTGTDNAMYRVGDDVVVRMPLRPGRAAETLAKEHEWLPVLAPQLPLRIPVPLASGEPTDFYPWPWSVYPWLAGEDATTAPLDLTQAAVDLAQFIRALGAIATTGAPEPSAANFGRGVPLATRDDYTRAAIAASERLIDTEAVTAAWEAALRAPAWGGAPAWIHGDLASGNLLVADGRLSAVIDWGGAAIGDPACDMHIAWEMFDGPSREIFRAETGVDDATWARG
ncbi:MAG TPA: aminoglycoside phosphotransferase family protein, partial [Acidimicrobiia bacterium]|nr:aminoglycoside phosphotransferase family protein [Acidimicrobiia bacterium]